MPGFTRENFLLKPWIELENLKNRIYFCMVFILSVSRHCSQRSEAREHPLRPSRPVVPGQVVRFRPGLRDKVQHQRDLSPSDAPAAHSRGKCGVYGTRNSQRFSRPWGSGWVVLYFPFCRREEKNYHFLMQIHENSRMGHTAQCLFNKYVIYLLHYSSSHDLTTHTLTVKIKHYCGLVV